MMREAWKFRLDHARPDKGLVEAFKGLPAANVDDCMSRMAAVSAEIRPVNRAPLLGTAFTVRVPAGDNLMFHKAMDLALPGDDSGVVVPEKTAEKVLALAKSIEDTEQKIIAGVKAGSSLREAREQLGYHHLQSKE